jgi:hypothetical protein
MQGCVRASVRKSAEQRGDLNERRWNQKGPSRMAMVGWQLKKQSPRLLNAYAAIFLRIKHTKAKLNTH